MRQKVKVSRQGCDFTVTLVESQFTMVVNCAETFLEYVPRPSQRSLVLGPASEELLSMVSQVGRQGAAGPGRQELHLSGEQVHALYSLLMWLPTCFNSEEAFFFRVGSFKENLAGVAGGIFMAMAEMP